MPHKAVLTKTRALDLTGGVYGKWTVLARVPRPPGRAGGSYWLCQCKCGGTRVKKGTNLVQRPGTSGCTRCRCHGASKTPEYLCWSGMKARCYNPKTNHFHRYGGRGITVCRRWMDSFPNFLADMGPRPDGMSLDRIDPNGNYEPSNCRWLGSQGQIHNSTTLKLSDEQVAAVRVLLDAGAHLATLAASLGMSEGHIRLIAKGRARQPCTA